MPLLVYIVLLREKHPGHDWFSSGETFTTREAAERDITTGRSAFFDYRVMELLIEVPRD